MPPVQQTDKATKRRHAAYAAETTGLLVIGFLILAITIVRYWHVIHWSLR